MSPGSPFSSLRGHCFSCWEAASATPGTAARRTIGHPNRCEALLDALIDELTRPLSYVYLYVRVHVFLTDILAKLKQRRNLSLRVHADVNMHMHVHTYPCKHGCVYAMSRTSVPTYMLCLSMHVCI